MLIPVPMKYKVRTRETKQAAKAHYSLTRKSSIFIRLSLGSSLLTLFILRRLNSNFDDDLLTSHPPPTATTFSRRLVQLDTTLEEQSGVPRPSILILMTFFLQTHRYRSCGHSALLGSKSSNKLSFPETLNESLRHKN